MTLPRDISRCKGEDYGGQPICPERDQCARYITWREEKLDGNAAGTMVMASLLYDPKRDAACGERINVESSHD